MISKVNTKTKKLAIALIVIAVAVFVVVITLSRGLGAPSDAQAAAAIKKVIAADSSAYADVTSVAEVLENMKAIDLSECPDDFADAYRAHIAAWEAMAQLEKDALVWGEAYGISGELTSTFMRNDVYDFDSVGEASPERDRLADENQRITKDVISTFKQVEKIARSYGVDLP